MGFQKTESLAHGKPFALWKKNLDAHSGFLCLTPRAERAFAEHGKSRFLPWCVDQDLFDGMPARQKPKRPFFLATGKTCRDYDTLVEAAQTTDMEIRIIGPENQYPKALPSNVRWINTSDDPPDKAIDYPTLREWYAQCTGVCIPLNGDPEDTSGYTNLLEAMAMSKAVIMTRSGCLQLNPRKSDSAFWSSPRMWLTGLPRSTFSLAPPSWLKQWDQLDEPSQKVNSMPSVLAAI